jgi:hypothetical protein
MFCQYGIPAHNCGGQTISDNMCEEAKEQNQGSEKASTAREQAMKEGHKRQ